MKIDFRKIENGNIAELYITATPSQKIGTEQQAEKIFSEIKNILLQNHANILQERIFADHPALKTALSIRNKIYGSVNDGVEPARLVVPEGITGPIAGVQVHAISGCANYTVVEHEQKPYGRIFNCSDIVLLALSAVCGQTSGNPSLEAEDMFNKCNSLLNQAGLNMFNVARTWMWIRNILDWYAQFNSIRNNFFRQWGLIGNGTPKMPASTGVGIGPDNDNTCAMDLIAAFGKNTRIEYLNAGGNQLSAFEYGSAFSRASAVNTFAGRTIFVSGTASIDTDGKTINTGNPHAQIQNTIDNVLAVLQQFGTSEKNIVQAIAYCKTPDIEKIFLSDRPGLDWPIMTAIGHICRDDLLFEIEATALKPYS